MTINNFKAVLLTVLRAMILTAYPFLSLKAQPLQGGLKIGNPIPDIRLNHLLGKTGKSIELSQLKGKLIILDFWSTYCSSCITAMPGLDSLQAEFGEKIKIILVTKNKGEDVTKLFRRIKMNLPHLDLETNDTLLNKLFPHQSDPHHVWINKEGVYKYATFSYNATEQNIKDVLNGENLTVSQKIDDNSFDKSKRLFQQSFNKRMSSNEGYSLIKKGLYKTLSLSMGPLKFISDSSTGQKVGFEAINATPITLIQAAFCNELYGFDIGYVKKNYRMLVNVHNPEELYQPRDKSLIDSWRESNLLSYEVIVPKEKYGQLYSKMQSDLNFYLPVKGHIENRMIECYVLEITGNSDSLKSNGNKQMTNYAQGRITISGWPMKKFVKYLQLAHGNDDDSLPFIDGTSYNGKISLTLSLSLLSNIDKFNLEIAKYGLAINKKSLLIPMLIVEDNN